MNVKIFKKSICLITVWVFLLSQVLYASILYDDTFGLPSSSGENMPTYDENSSGWRDSNLEPLSQAAPEPISSITSPLPFELPAELGEYDRLDVSVELEGIESATWHLLTRTPEQLVPLWFYNDSQFSEDLKTYLQVEKAQGEEVTHLVIYDAYLTLNEPKGYLLVVAKGDIELKGKHGLKGIMPTPGPGSVQLFNGKESREGAYPGTYQDALRDIQNGLLTGIIDTNGKFTWKFYQ